MIDLGTLAGLHRHQHQLAAYCQHCDRWAVIELAAMVDAGLGDRRLPIKVRCHICGELGRPQVRPPVPTRGPGSVPAVNPAFSMAQPATSGGPQSIGQLIGAAL